MYKNLRAVSDNGKQVTDMIKHYRLISAFYLLLVWLWVKTGRKWVFFPPEFKFLAFKSSVSFNRKWLKALV